MARTPPDLSGVYLKLERAETHIQTLSDEVAAFSERDPKPFGFRTEDATGTDNSIKYDLYAVIREEPPCELALPFGDAIQNIRAAESATKAEPSGPDLHGSVRVQGP